MMKLKFVIIVKKIFLSLIFSLIIWGIGCIIGILISNQFNYKLKDVIITESLILVIIGILLSMKGSHSGLNLSGAGQSNENAVLYQHLETLRLEQEIERKSDEYFNNYYRRNVLRIALSNFTFIIGGIFLMAFGQFLL
jgi:hypothetical protein